MTLILLTLTLAADPTPIEPAKLTRTTPIDYAADVQPILAGKCTVCHSGATTEGRFDLGTHAALTKGGKRGPAVVPGKPAESSLYLFSAHNKKPIMPPRSENNDLTPNEVAILKLWIEQGAKGPTGPEIKVRPKVALTMPAATVVPVRAVAVKPDKSTVAVGRGNQLHLFDAKTGKHARMIADPALKSAAHLSLIDSLAFSPDGKTLAAGCFREVVLWDADAGTVRHRLTGFAHAVTALAFAPDGKSLVCGGGAPTEDGEVRLFDPASGKLTLELKSPHSDTVYGVAVSPDGKLLATAGADKFVKVWELPAGKFTKSFEGHTQHVLDVGWTPDGKRLVSAGADGAIKSWDYEKGEKVRDILQPGKVQMTRLSFVGAKAEFLVAAGDGSVRLMNPDGGTVRGYAGATDFVYAVSAASDGSVVVAGGEDGVARLYDGGGKLVGSLVPPK